MQNMIPTEPVLFDHSYGWRCPLCGRVYSPNTPMCFYCGNEKYSTGTGTGDAPDFTSKIICEVE